MLLTALLLLAAAPAGEDAAHREDRLRTEALNRRAARAVRAPQPSARDQAAWEAAQADYREARADYRAAQDSYARDLARWRQQVADCRAGDDRACRAR